MSNLPLLVVGIVAVLGLCFVHSKIETAVPRSKFVLLGLFSLGSLPLGYTTLWVVADQAPDFSLAHFVAFGLTLWVTALAYGAVAVLARTIAVLVRIGHSIWKDIAPSP